MDNAGQAADLLAQLTLEEKASLCLGSDMWHTAAIPRLGIPAVMVADGPHGLRRQPDAGDPAALSGSLPATCFPTASALGSSWDPDLVRRVGDAIGVEARAQGVDVVLGPGINIKRSPLCGRNFEYLSEDPYLAGLLGAALVEGLQSQGVGACVKHFAVNNQETDRLRISADVDDRALREIYLPAFEYIVTHARPWTVMCSYNKVNGVYASQHRWLLTDVLRTEWGFDGVVVSDWGAVHDRVAALAAGLDLEMPPNLGISDRAIVTAVRDGALDERTVDAAARRVLRLVDRATSETSVDVDVDVDAHHKLARVAATECAVLLKNEGAVLPVATKPGDVIAVVGEFARRPRYQGAGSSKVNATRVDAPFDELRTAAPSNVEVAYATGFNVESGEHDEALAASAVALAERATVVIAFLGLPPAAETEGVDRMHIDLPENQTHLLRRLATANASVVVVLANGSAVRVSTWEQHADAILECWLSGQAVGGAIADLLYGVANPSGRLAETIPLRLEDNPAYLNFPGEAGHVRYGEGVFVGYRGYDATRQEVSYPFGHGLSYTTFAYAGLTVTTVGSAVDGDLTLTVNCTIANTGRRRGKEVVQLYVGDVEAQVARPVRELRKAAKVDLEPGASTPVTFTLDARDLSYWSVAGQCWLLEPGAFRVEIGASSRDIRLATTVDIAAPPSRVRLDGLATLREWLSHPDGGTALRRAFGTDADGRPAGILGDEERLTVLGNFPLSRLATFPGIGITQASLQELLSTLGSPETT